MAPPKADTLAASVMASSKHRFFTRRNDQFKFSLNETVPIRRKVSKKFTGGPFQPFLEDNLPRDRSNPRLEDNLLRDRSYPRPEDNLLWVRDQFKCVQIVLSLSLIEYHCHWTVNCQPYKQYVMFHCKFTSINVIFTAYSQ